MKSSTHHSAHVVQLFTDEQRIANARLLAQERRLRALADAFEAERQKHAREWIAFDFTREDLGII